MLAFGFLFWGLLNVCCPLVSAILLKESNVPLPPDTCMNLVCEQTYEQARGLAKLALLDEFVSQTVLLLKDLMQNIDGELEKSANSLLRYIHPHCEPTRKILREVIQKQEGTIVIGSSELSEGVDPMEKEESETPESPFVAENEDDHHDETGEKHFPLPWDSEGDESYNVSHDDLDYDSSSVYGTSTDHKNGNSGGIYSSTATSQERKRDKGKPKQRGKPKEGSNKREHKGKAQNKKDKGKPHPSNKKNCRGVEKGSAFWVPGLNKWCVDNCSRGYCPKTHCIC